MKIKGISIENTKESIQYFGISQSIFKLPFRLLMVILQYMCMKIVYSFVKKEKKTKIVIGFSNTYYTGNPRAVFEYMMRYPDKYDVFWVAKNRCTIKEIKKAGGKVFYIYGLLGISYFLRADVWVLAHTGIGNIPFLPHRNYKLVQLWHGIGPKGINHTKKDYEAHDLWCVSSEFSKERHITLWGAPSTKLRVTGFARMDKLLEYLKVARETLLEEMGIKNGEKIILYAPTFDVGLWPWGDPYEEFEKFCKFCKKNNLILILRLHPLAKINKRKLKKLVKIYENVYWLDMPKEPDTMKLLAVADILITDWSSIYTDYFLTKRPIIYLEVNKDFYTKARGKPEIPPEFRAGEIAHNSEEFYKALNTVLKEGNRHAEKQEKLLKIIHGNVDGKASERVAKVIEELLH